VQKLWKKLALILLFVDRCYEFFAKAVLFTFKYTSLPIAILFMFSQDYKDASICFIIAIVLFGVDYVKIIVPRKWRRLKSTVARWMYRIFL
jgi:hypothetical protein